MKNALLFIALVACTAVSAFGGYHTGIEMSNQYEIEQAEANDKSPVPMCIHPDRATE